MTERNYWQRLKRNRMTRRSLLRASGRAGVGAAGLALVGCGDDDDDGQQSAAQTSAAQQQQQQAAQQQAQPQAQQQQAMQQQAQQQTADQTAQQADQQEQTAVADAEQQQQQQQQAMVSSIVRGGDLRFSTPAATQLRGAPLLRRTRRSRSIFLDCLTRDCSGFQLAPDGRCRTTKISLLTTRSGGRRPLGRCEKSL